MFLGGLHALFVGGTDINGILLLQIYIIGLLVLALIVYVYRSLVHGAFHKFYNYTVQSTIPKGDVIELDLKADGSEAPHLPGQFAFVKFEVQGVLNESHPFTISSHPNVAGLRFSIKQLGDYTRELSNLQNGTKVKIDGGYGTFSNAVITKPHQVWVAGGIGITPFLAMAKQLPQGQSVDLFYSLKTKSEAVYLDELQTDSQNDPNLKLHTWYTDTQGYLTAEQILKQVAEPNNTVFLICGPPPMMSSLRSQLRILGVKNDMIQTEEFSLE